MYDTNTHMELVARKATLEAQVRKCKEAIANAQSHIDAINVQLSAHLRSEAEEKRYSAQLPTIKRRVISVLGSHRNQSVEDLVQHIYEVPEPIVRKALTELRRCGSVRFSSKEHWNLNR
jgi:hypothetical protein